MKFIGKYVLYYKYKFKYNSKYDRTRSRSEAVKRRLAFVQLDTMFRFNIENILFPSSLIDNLLDGIHLHQLIMFDEMAEDLKFIVIFHSQRVHLQLFGNVILFQNH